MADARCDDACVTLLTSVQKTAAICSGIDQQQQQQQEQAAADALGAALTAGEAVVEAAEVAKNAARESNSDLKLSIGGWHAAAASSLAAARADVAPATPQGPRAALKKLLEVYEAAALIGCAKILLTCLYDIVEARVEAGALPRVSPANAWAARSGSWPTERVDAQRELVRARGPMGTEAGYLGARAPDLGEVGRRWLRVVRAHGSAAAAARAAAAAAAAPAAAEEGVGYADVDPLSFGF